MTEACDVLIVGAGPAGLAAAVQARELGLSVTVVDEQCEPGGQIYRAVERAERDGRAASLADDYRHGLRLIDAFRRCGAIYFPAHQVWQIEPDGRAYVSDGTASHAIAAQRVIVAVGAIERPVPVARWTLPGVMSVGSAQILLKTVGLRPDGGVWLAGSGPLALAYASQLVACGGRLAGFLDTSRAVQRRTAIATQWRGALRGWRYIAKGLRYYASLRRSGMRIVEHVDAVEPVGQARVERVRWRVGSKWEEAPASGLLLHEGVIPNTHLTQSIGCAHEWNAQQLCFQPVVDRFGATDLAAIFVAGDCGGIGGARVAEKRGRLAALSAATSLQRLSIDQRDRIAAATQRELDEHFAIRGFLDALYRPPPELLAPADDVMVCRCESITARRIREAVALGCRGPNQVKSFTRCGMGPCQGRMCGPTITGIIAAELRASPQDVGTLRVRPPLKPLRLEELVMLADDSSAPTQPRATPPLERVG